jgi:glycerophosphoryl diester phosphodiesterase
VGIEVDLAFTKDGAAVLLHDDAIDRTSNGVGQVQDKTLQELRALSFGESGG